ncbi:MAG TPA: CHC2 zinc finger domain-containing protein, partial [Actinoplanes sp.]|nr:CHC2 zinc finger domain-containing protein [Actinoplanes sp.]
MYAVAGRVKDEDIALVRDRTSIADIISESVTLRSAGGGNLKGLCPFHDEKTPSFTVAPARNVYYCHGCGAGGDAIKFLMDAEHLSFIESIERLASRSGIQLRYETDNSPSAPRPQTGQRQRLLAAHLEAGVFYREQLGTPGARKAREFLAQRGFGRDAAERYGCGFAPDSWDALAKHLRQKGFTAEELNTAGLTKPARSGSLIDRFRR